MRVFRLFSKLCHFAKKSGCGISPSGDGIFDFGKILLKKVLNSNTIKRASQAINSDLGQKAIKGVKRAIQSDVRHTLKKKAISEIKNKAKKVLDSAPTPIKKAVQSELGQEVQKKILALTPFEKLGILEPTRKRKRNTKSKGGKRKKGEGFVNPQTLISQFGSGIILE